MLRRFQGREIETVELESAEKVWAETVDSSSFDTVLETLRDCLKTLDGRTRQAIDLFYRDRLGRTEMAEALEMKPEGVKTLLRRTRDALRKCIERKSSGQ